MTRAVRKSAFLNRCAYGQKEKIVFIRERAYVAGEVTLGEGANIRCVACVRGDVAPV